MYAFNSRAIPADLTGLWSFWESKNLSQKEKKFMKTYLKKRKLGKRMVLSTVAPENKGLKPEPCVIKLDFTKPTAVLASNVIWDAASLSVNLQFDNMFEWVRQVICFFVKNKQFNLIIKAHPAEQHSKFPNARQLLEDEIKKTLSFTSNICFLPPKTQLTIYDVLPMARVGLVFTSTVGLEMACRGIPVITAGRAPYYNKGFTFDPINSEEYFVLLKRLLDSDLGLSEKNRISESALKFLYNYHFLYSFRLNLFDFSVDDGITLHVKNIKSLLPGKNKALDYICDSILKKEPIFSENRWFAPDLKTLYKSI
jgi:hypothetical protein